MSWLSRLFSAKPKGTIGTKDASAECHIETATPLKPLASATASCATCGRMDVTLTPCMSCQKLFCDSHGKHCAGMFACSACLASSRRDWTSRIGR